MAETRELQRARRCLADAENDLESAEGLARLTEGLELLDDIMGVGAAEAATARNLAATYASRVYARVRVAVERDGQIPEPRLEQYFKTVLAFDRVAAELPPAAAELKIAVVRQLIDRYYEGHPAAAKRRAFDELAKLSRRG